MQINELLTLLVEKRASDLHLMVASPPVFRIDGKIIPQTDFAPLIQKDMEEIFNVIASQEQRDKFYRELELDFAYSIPGISRFRVSVLRQRGTLGFTFRTVPFSVPTIDELKLPTICKELVLKPRGLILVTGSTGSGKSTTMAAMVNYLNNTEARKVITIEDPIEYLYHHEKCIIAQRELGDDTRSFSSALIHALRQDPDVIVIGEMRDLDTVATALRAAETGHLVIGTLHTTDAPQSIDRIIDIFPPDQQQQVRLQLSQVLEAVLSQALLPRVGGKGRVAAFEIMLATTAVRNLIREGRISDLSNTIQLSTKDGMQTLDQALADLVKKGLATKEDVMVKTSNPERLEKILQYSGGKKIQGNNSP
jgi:twitching motility protein PilT